MDFSIVPSFRARVLSIQSHVVHGCVGNSAATFPMQIHGLDVDAFNILSFSNHTGYPLFKGFRITAEQFSQVAEGLSANGFTEQYDYVLSGYVGNAPVMEEIAKLLKEMGERRVGSASGGFTYVCDPVCGDLGKLYVSDECVGIYRSLLLPLAAVALPNGFEASVLSGIEINSVATAQAAANWFHREPKVGVVVIKSFHDAELDPEGRRIFMLVSEAGAEGGVDDAVRHLVEVEYVTGYFTGTGDTFGGLFMAHYAKSRNAAARGKTTEVKCIAQCVAAAATGTFGVLKRTQAYRASLSGGDEAAGAAPAFSELRGVGHSDDFRARELMIVHSADILLSDALAVTVRRL